MRPRALPFTLGVLYDPEEAEPPSGLRTLDKLAEIAKRRHVTVKLGTFDDLKNLDYDALFIRQTTSVGGAAHTLAQAAVTRGLPVIDDPASIEASCDKLEMAVRFFNAGIPTPKSITLKMPIDLRALEQQIAPLGWPVVIKDPATCFSRGVFKAENRHELLEVLTKLSHCPGGLVQAQEYIPTRYDWRIGILGGRPIYCCQYGMAKDHWQVIKHHEDGTYLDGSYITFSPTYWPQDICSLAVRAAKCVGNGLYGVDLKERGQDLLVIEVNDNPTIDAGEEDKYGNVWERLLEHFRNALATS